MCGEIMKKYIHFLLILIFLFISRAHAFEEDVVLKEFMNMLSKDVYPTISDFYKFYGEGSEFELQLALDNCEKNKWIPPLTNQKCIDFIQNREANRDITKSLFFDWLRTKIPLSPKLKIIKIEKVRGDNVLEYDLIYASLNGDKVIFWKTFGNEINIGQFGLISISKINDFPIQQMLENDLKNKKNKTDLFNSEKSGKKNSLK